MKTDQSQLNDPRLAGFWTRRDVLTDEEKVVVAQVEKWFEYYAADPDRMTYELYSDDMRLVIYDGPNATANTQDGHNVLPTQKSLSDFEKRVKAKVPRRFFRRDRLIVSGNIATVQFALIDPDRPGWELPCCSLLTFRGDKIISEQAYLNIAAWPGAVPETT